MNLRSPYLWVGIGLLWFPALASEAAHGSQKPGGLFQLDPGVSIWTIVVFLLLVVLLKKFAWQPIIKALDDREKAINESLDKAKNANTESARIASEQAAILSEAKVEAAKVLRETKMLAEEVAQKIKDEAQKEKQKILDSGIKEIEAAKLSAIADIKSYASNLAIKAAEKLITQNLDSEGHRKLVDKLIEEIA